MDLIEMPRYYSLATGEPVAVPAVDVLNLPVSEQVGDILVTSSRTVRLGDADWQEALKRWMYIAYGAVVGEGAAGRKEDGRFVTLGEGGDRRVVFIGGPGQGAGGTEQGGGAGQAGAAESPYRIVGNVDVEAASDLVAHYESIPDWARSGVKGLTLHAGKGERFEVGGKGFVTAASWDMTTQTIELFQANTAHAKWKQVGYTPLEHEVGHSLWDRWADDARKQEEQNGDQLRELWRSDAPEAEVDAAIAKLAPLYAARQDFMMAWGRGEDGITAYSKAWAESNMPTETVAEMAEVFFSKGAGAEAAKALKALCREHKANKLYKAFMQMVGYYEANP